MVGGQQNLKYKVLSPQRRFTIPSNHLIRVQRLPNWAARLILQLSRDYPSQPLLSSLHTLPLKHKIFQITHIFYFLFFVNKVLNNQAPKYLGEPIEFLRTPTSALRSASDPLRLAH